MKYKSWTPGTAEIVSVFDHSMTTTYCPDGIVTGFTGESGTVVAANETAVVTGCGSLHSYKKADGSAFILNGHYIGTQQSGPTVLNYDGHAGIDYAVPYGTDVFAAAEGQIVVADINNSTSAGNYVRIQHGDYGYQSQYLHLSEILVTEGQQVTRGQLIGRSGNTAGPSGNVGAHLHFEAKRLTSGTWVSVDPYGWQGTGADPYTVAVNVNLWESGGQPGILSGIDVSSYQGAINWTQVKNDGNKAFAIIRASAGKNTTDGHFPENASGAVAAGLLVSTYHFAYPEDFTAHDEAQKFLSVAKAYIGNGFLPPALDIEDSPNENSYPSRLGSAVLSQWIRDWCTEVQNATGVKPMIYATRYYANNYFETSLNQYGYWVPTYPADPSTSPSSLSPWGSWAFQQYRTDPDTQKTDPNATVEPLVAGRCPGISGYVDLDSFNGGLAELQALATAGGSATSEFTITTSPSGQQVTVDGHSYTSPVTFDWVSASTHTVSTPQVQFSSDQKTRFVFANWSDGLPQTHTITAPATSATYTARFSTQYLLDISISPQGSAVINTDPQGPWFDPGQIVNLTATPGSGYSISHWSGVDTRSGNTAQLTMTTPRSVAATFDVAPVEFTVATSPSGQQVTVDSQTFTAPVTFNWSPGSQHTIGTSQTQSSADQKTRYIFTAWSDGLAQTHTISAPAASDTFTARFATQYLLEVTAGFTVKATPEGPWYDSGQVVQLLATPLTGGLVTWSGVDNQNGNSAQLTMAAPKVVTATLAQSLIEFTIATSPSGQQVTVDGTSYPAPVTFNWLPGSTHTLSTSDPQISAEPKTRFVFANWSDGLGQTHSLIAAETPATYTARFSTQYLLEINRIPSDGVTVASSPDGPWYTAGQVVSLTATPQPGYTMTWSGVDSSNGNVAQVNMNAPKVITASASQSLISYKIITSPPGIALTVDGQPYTGPASFEWLPGSPHQIAASQQSLSGDQKTRYSFSSWSDGLAQAHQITVTSAVESYTASYKTEYFLSMSAEPPAAVVISADPPGPWYDAGQSVQLTALVQADYAITSWTGVDAQNGATAQLLMNGPRAASVVVKKAALSLDAGAVNANREFLFSFNGRQDRLYRVEASDNLSNWALIRTYVNPVRAVNFTDSDSPSHSRRYYRVVEITP